MVVMEFIECLWSKLQRTSGLVVEQGYERALAWSTQSDMAGDKNGALRHATALNHVLMERPALVPDRCRFARQRCYEANGIQLNPCMTESGSVDVRSV